MRFWMSSSSPVAASPSSSSFVSSTRRPQPANWGSKNECSSTPTPDAEALGYLHDSGGNVAFRLDFEDAVKVTHEALSRRTAKAAHRAAGRG
jgi:hypothetical protein